MKTFTELRELTENPNYHIQRQKCLRHLSDNMIDIPIIKIIKGLNKLPYCFTLQSCYGHFTYDGQNDSHNFESLPINGTIGTIRYRIAYIALCLEKSLAGKEFFLALKKIPSLSPENIQLCCAEWFWKKQINSYVLQVEPDRFKHEDTADIDLKEALLIETIRNKFFAQLNELLNN